MEAGENLKLSVMDTVKCILPKTGSIQFFINIVHLLYTKTRREYMIALNFVNSYSPDNIFYALEVTILCNRTVICTYSRGWRFMEMEMKIELEMWDATQLSFPQWRISLQKYISKDVNGDEDRIGDVREDATHVSFPQWRIFLAACKTRPRREARQIHF